MAIKKNNNKKAGEPTKVRIYRVDSAQQKEEKRRKRDKAIQSFLIVLIVILAVAAIASAVQTFFPNFISNIFGKWSLSGELAAKVNGKPITMAQLNEEYDRLPEQYKYFLTKETFLKQLIDEELLTEEAAKQGISVTEKDVDESLNTFMQENNVTQGQLEQILTEKKLTYQQLRNLVRNQLIIDKLLEKEVTAKVNVTSEEALTYYNDNPTTFKVPEMVTARHILIGLVNRTQEQAKKTAEDVLSKLKKDNSNFCDLVGLYSDDSGSIDNCGEYSFPRGQMVEEFENTAFEQGAGNVSLINTTYGYHIIWTVNKTTEQLIKFEDVEEQIKGVLAQQEEKMLYSELIVGLRAKAKVIDYLEQKTAEENVSGVQTAEEGVNPQINIAAVEEPETTETTLPEEEISEEQEELENETEQAVEEVAETVSPPQPPVPPATVPQPELGFADCLTSKGAVFYGIYWDSSTKTQKAYFGNDIVKIKYVECGIPGDYRTQTQECEDAGIHGYPTWIIDGKKYMGIQELSQLAALTGCEI